MNRSRLRTILAKRDQSQGLAEVSLRVGVIFDCLVGNIKKVIEQLGGIYSLRAISERYKQSSVKPLRFDNLGNRIFIHVAILQQANFEFCQPADIALI